MSDVDASSSVHDEPVLVDVPGARTDLGLAHHHDTPDTGSPAPTEASVPNVTIPSHRLPPGFRGPIPRAHDAEDIAPVPVWTPCTSETLPDGLGLTPHLPMNKGGWRYMAAGPSAHTLPWTVYRSLEIAPEGVHWSWQDRSAFTRISQDAMVVGADKGFRSVRTNLGVREGAWYVELDVLPPDASSMPTKPMRDGPHVRLGWGRREASLNAPVGWDAYSYGLRDQNGACVSKSHLVPLGRPFGPGDVVGMYIRLPPVDAARAPGTESRIQQKRIPIRYKGQLYFESLEYAPTREMLALMDEQRGSGSVWTSTTTSQADEKRPRGRSAPSSHERQQPTLRPLPTLEDSCIGFVVNGEPQGMAFTELYDYRPLLPKPKKRRHPSEITAHTNVSAILKSRENELDDGMLGYYVMASMYGGARVRLRTDEFRYPPPADLEDQLWRAGCPSGVSAQRQTAAPPWKPLAARYQQALDEARHLDLAEEASVAAKLDTGEAKAESHEANVRTV